MSIDDLDSTPKTVETHLATEKTLKSIYKFILSFKKSYTEKPW